MSAQFPSSNKEYSCYIAIFADTLFNVHAYFFSQLRGTLHEFQMNY